MAHISTQSEAEARLRFADQLALFDLALLDSEAVDMSELVAQATDLLVYGVDPEPVVALASQVVTPFSNAFEMNELVHRAREELGMPALDWDGTAIRAAQGQLRCWRQGLLTDREILTWAHRAVGHRGPAVVQQLAEAEDLLDELEYDEAPTDRVHDDLVAIADELLAIPDPWRLR